MQMTLTDVHCDLITLWALVSKHCKLHRTLQLTDMGKSLDFVAHHEVLEFVAQSEAPFANVLHLARKFGRVLCIERHVKLV